MESSNLLCYSLLSGLIGAIIGGFLSYLGSIKAAEKTVKALYQQEAKKKKEEEQELRRSVAKRLLAEVKENLSLSDEVQISHAKIRFITEIWSVVKGNIYFLKEELQENLQKAYSEIHRYNVLADYDQEKVPLTMGSLDSAIVERAQKVKKALLLCKEKLEEFSKED
ncbi:MAG: hypothetical protein WBA71_04100 [Candidatus Humimicrobiia bacterium]